MNDDKLERRKVLQGLGAVLVGVKLPSLVGCGSSGDGAPSSGDVSDRGADAGSTDGGTPGLTPDGGVSPGVPGEGGSCELYPRETAGPFYFDAALVRRDITEGKPGVPMALAITVLRADGCTPVEGALVDVWHNDAAGVYSGYPNQRGGLNTTGQTFLRGIQPTNAEGLATFDTIYPGWYPGRTTHVHFKVHLDDRSLVTSQMYFPDDVTAQVYASPGYAASGQKDTTNAQDTIATNPMPPLLSLAGSVASGYTAKLTITVMDA